jgi:hypothetical protein
LTSNYEALAAKRYREFLWQERKEIWRDKLIAFSMRTLTYGVAVMQQAGLTKRRTIERVSVE